MPRPRLYRQSTVTVPNLSAEINRVFADSGRDEVRFWRLLEDYIGKVANRLVTQDLLLDAVQDCLIQVFKSLPKFKPRAEHDTGGVSTSFSRWVCGLVWRRCAHMRRTQFTSREIPVSQLPYSLGDEESDAQDITELDQDGDDAERSAVAELLSQDLINADLDRFRSLLPASNHALFDLMRTGISARSAAHALHLSEDIAQSRKRQWRRIAASLKENDARD